VVRIIGRQPKPRALLQGLDDAVAERVKPLFPTWRVVGSLDEVDQDEWDVLVTTDTVAGAESHLHVIAIGCKYIPIPLHLGGRTSSLGECQLEEGKRVNACYSGRIRATEFHIPENLPLPLGRLAELKLLPLVRERENHATIGPAFGSPAPPTDLLAWRSAVQPFVATAKGAVLAGRFPREGGRAECWSLPEYAEGIAPEFIEAALAEWSKRDPETFPSSVWVDLPRWRTSQENRVATELDTLRAKRTELLASMGEQEEVLLAELVKAKQAAEIRERVLLTGTGDALVEVVVSCLTDLGFDVQNMDTVYPSTDRREDLQIRNPDMPGWVALTEVKGYTTGAKANDLLKFGRYRLRYLKDNGREADAAWYVVNQFGGQDPGSRPPVLAASEPELATFAEDGGLAVDTAKLFQVWMAVREDRLSANEARASLAAGTGRFTLPWEALQQTG